MPLEVGTQRVLFEQASQFLFDGLLEILDGRAFGLAALKLLAQPVEIVFADIVGNLLLDYRVRLHFNHLVNHLVQLADDIADIGLFAILFLRSAISVRIF